MTCFQEHAATANYKQLIKKAPGHAMNSSETQNLKTSLSYREADSIYVFFLWLIHYIPDGFKLQESLTK